jgi:hypothetical protein
VTKPAPRKHFLVYDRGEPWKNTGEIIDDYCHIFDSQLSHPNAQRDLANLGTLRGDSYEYVVCVWDGTGSTPRWFWQQFGAQRVIFVSEEML